jgi:hypothetical protein
MYEFLQAIKNPTGKNGANSGFSVMIGNYSDKSTILTKLINIDAKDESGKRFLDMSSDEILNTIRKQSKNYYGDLFQSTFAKYKQILGNKINVTEFRNNINIFNDNIKEINNFLSKNDVLDYSKHGLVEELDYSKYGKQTALNQLLIDYYRIFTNDGEFKKFIDLQEKSLINKYINANNSDKINYIFEKDDSLNKTLKVLKIEPTSFKDFEKISDENGVLNPLVKK